MAQFYGIGANNYYQLGLGNTTPQTIWTSIVSLDAAQLETSATSSTLVRLTSGTLWGWGRNASGELGTGNTTSVQTPTEVSTTVWSAVSMGYDHTLAIRDSDGALFGWGENGQYQLGTGDTTDRRSPTAIDGTRVWTHISAGSGYSLGVTSDGKLWAWGNGSNYRLGLNDTISRSVPTQVGSDTDWVYVSAGQSHSFGIKSDGKLYGWGYNVNRQLGFASGNYYTVPTQVGTDTDWAVARASIGAAFSHAIKSGGALYATGVNTYGVLGVGDTVQRSTFTRVGSDNWASISNKAGQHVVAVKADGTLWGWGRNDNTSWLGGDSNNYSSPTQIDAETTWSLVSAGSGFSVAATASSTGGVASAPTSITITNRTGTASAATSINITGEGTASAPTSIAIFDSLVTSAWSAKVLLGGVDVSNLLEGALSVDAEEGAARVASFTLAPAAGAIDPIEWVGASVVISLLRVASGQSVATRMFKGKVDVPSFDPVAGRVSFVCVDDLQNRVAALSKEEIDTLVGGRYHVGAQGQIDEHWEYAQARLESVPASLDANAYGNFRVTPWDGLAVWKTFTEEDVLDQSLSIDLPRRTDLVNRVDVAYEYRYYRCRQRVVNLSWATTIIGPSALARAYAQPSRDEARSAVHGTGWEVLAESYYPGWAYVATGEPSGYTGEYTGSEWWLQVPGSDQCGSFSASLGQRHAQNVSETYTLTVTSPQSIAHSGELVSPLRGAYETSWTPEQWEQDWSVDTPDASVGDVDYAGSETRAESDECIAALVDMAKTKILSSHRHARVGFAIPCMPELDLIHAVSLDADAIEATGKVVRVEHTLNIDSGEATTLVTMALSGVESTGIASTDASDPPSPPDVDEATGDDNWWLGVYPLGNWTGAYTLSPPYTAYLAGYLVNAPEQITVWTGDWTEAVVRDNPSYDAAETYDTTGFRILLPGVADTHRNPLSIPVEADYTVEVPIDPLTLTVV